MADVTPRGGGGLRSAPDADRGQLFIVGALALSVILVALAVLLNTAIYTGNVATRDTGVETTTVVEFDNGAVAMAERTLQRVNYANDTSYAHLHANFTGGVSAWSQSAGQHVAISGGDAFVQANTTNGTRIVQDTERNFTNATGAQGWTIADGVAVRNYTLTMNETTLPNIADDDEEEDFGDTFHIDVHGQSTEWEVYVYENSGETRVAVVEGGSTLLGRCSTTDASPTVDVTNASLAGSHCSALDFWGDAEGPLLLEYMDVGTVEGTYSLVVDKDLSTLDTSDFNTAVSGDSPYVTPAIYSADVEVTYRSPSVYYNRTHRVAPGEPDA
jgi:hypothetical protein